MGISLTRSWAANLLVNKPNSLKTQISHITAPPIGLFVQKKKSASGNSRNTLNNYPLRGKDIMPVPQYTEEYQQSSLMVA
jgi:hypothetical protein